MGQEPRRHQLHDRNGKRIAELTCEDVAITSVQDVLDLIGDLIWGAGADAFIVHEHQVTPEFFDLSTRLAGEVLQKCTNYRVRIALVGHFDRYPSESLKAFVRESNRGSHIYFASSLEEAVEALGRP